MYFYEGHVPHIKLELLHILRSNIILCITAAAAAKSLQSCLTLCNPRDGSPPGSPVPGILQARTLECPSGLVPRVSCLIASSLSIIINFFCSPCQGLLFFYSSYLLQNTIEDSIKICKSYFYSFWFVSSGCVLKLEHERLLNDMVVHLQQDHGGHWPLKPEPAWQEATVAATSWTSFVPTEPLALDGHFQELGLFIRTKPELFPFLNQSHIQYVLKHNIIAAENARVQGPRRMPLCFHSRNIC